MKVLPSFSTLLETFFTERLMRQLDASPHTIASYRDTFRLLLRFAESKLNEAPSELTLDDLDAGFITAFLDHLEKNRGNTARTRNNRLGAIRSFFRWAAFQDPAHSALIQRVLAIPNKRHKQKPRQFLTEPEQDALLQAPDTSTWSGRRDRTLLVLDSQTGLRVSELVGLRRDNVVLGTGAHVRCRGKGRKERCVPLQPETVKVLQSWLEEHQGDGQAPLFPNARGGFMSPDGVQYLVAKHVRTAAGHCLSLKSKRISPHCLRHTAAMNLLEGGVDTSVIALWLGHERQESSDTYLHQSLKLKEQALARMRPPHVKPGRFRPDDRLLAFLKSL